MTDQPTDVPKLQQLRMIWPTQRLAERPRIRLHADYALRTYQPGDETGWYGLMDGAGFTGWDAARLAPTLTEILPDGWFFAVHRATGALAASAMATHAPQALHPFGGALGWVAGNPAHKGHGLGWVVCAAVTIRLLNAGYRNIYLLTDDWRLPALKIYLKLGYEPLLFAPDMAERWRTICEQLAWPFTPEGWQSTG
jgi:mycothiol synthase